MAKNVDKMNKYRKLSYPALARAMLDLEQRHAEAKAVAAEIWDEYTALVQQVIPQRLEMDQIQSIKVKLPDGEVRNLTVLDQISVKTLEGKKGDLFVWLRKHDAGDLITDTVNSSTLAAFVRAQIAAKEPIPKDCIEINTYQKATLRK